MVKSNVNLTEVAQRLYSENPNQEVGWLTASNICRVVNDVSDGFFNAIPIDANGKELIIKEEAIRYKYVWIQNPRTYVSERKSLQEQPKNFQRSYSIEHEGERIGEIYISGNYAFSEAGIIDVLREVIKHSYESENRTTLSYQVGKYVVVQEKKLKPVINRPKFKNTRPRER
jgi:hypothetical protein